MLRGDRSVGTTAGVVASGGGCDKSARRLAIHKDNLPEDIRSAAAALHWIRSRTRGSLKLILPQRITTYGWRGMLTPISR